MKVILGIQVTQVLKRVEPCCDEVKTHTGIHWTTTEATFMGVAIDYCPWCGTEIIFEEERSEGCRDLFNA